ncbi:Putative Cellodextrin transporter CdtD [Aspergillus calidoustus]|uniref:Putative Cellodextrin transporter CdtD n=1 Tax=Aspergillus calidoustus TaxID=454130 RepID=A0A0U5GS76_ASPCI|nr:Putative Cellodextrin transporter CdtD [Aspergillus calidoustus]
MGKDTFTLAGREWPKVTWWKMKGMRFVYLTLWAAMITSATNGYDGSLMNGLQALEDWKKSYNYPEGSTLGLLAASMSIGSMLAIPVVPYVADHLGRRVGVVIGCVIMLFGVAMVSIGYKVALFVVGRIILGFGLGIAQECSPLLVTELVHPQHRAVYSTIYNSLWYIGSLVGAGVALGTNKITGSDWSWRVPCLLQGAPSICQLVFIWMVPESPRWLVSKGRIQEAKKVLAYVHAQGDEDDELVNVEFDEIQQTIAMEKELEGNSWAEFWSTPGNRHRLIILVSIGFFSQWSGNGIVSYFLPEVLKLIGITDSNKVLTINLVLNAVNAVSATGIAFFVEHFGRRKLFLTSCMAMIACFTSTTISLARFPEGPGGKDTNAGNAVIAFIFLFYISYNIGFSGLLVSYSSEILPYRLRAKGLTIMFLCVNTSLWFNQYVNPIALKDIGWKYYIFYCVWLLFELFIVWKFYIETKETPLEEIAKFFDGDAAIVGGEAATEKVAQLVGRQTEAESEKGPTIHTENRE